MKPKRDLSQLHGHWIFVDAVDASLKDGAPNDVAVIQMLDHERPFVDGGLPNNVGACLFYAGKHRRAIGLIGPINGEF